MLEQPIPKVFLFVPATRPERIDKAFATGADEVIIDWEDTVSAEEKSIGRANTATYCAQKNAQAVWVRINSAQSVHHAEDLAAAKNLPNLKGVLLSKTERAADITAVSHALSKPVIADIESARGMTNIAEFAHAEGLFALTYGCLDFANDLGLNYGTEAAEIVFDRLRTDMLLHSRINHLHAPIETTFPDFNNTEAVKRNARHWQDMGFGGVLCIHPKQVAAVKEMIRPSENTLSFAKKVLAEYERSGAAVFQVEGQMIDAPVIERARQILSAK